ncbi:hypothetical protein [Oerskovia enterophila]|uniref:hypothetical protein n=1 Tax=Oerskovia enterophila TaxID=43678 RepID=UPI003804146A
MTEATDVVPVKKPKVKKPADHKPKAEKPKVEKVDGGRKVTHRGIVLTVEDAAFDDFELLDDLRAVQDAEDASRMPSLLRRLAGEDGYRAVMAGLRDKKTGRVSVMDGATFVQELFEAISPN